mgnify:CR=1 FL=1
MSNPVDDILGSLGGGMSPELTDLGQPPQFVMPAPPVRERPLSKGQEQERAKTAKTNTEPLAGMKKFGELAKLAGGGGARVRVRKRLDSGHLMHIDDFKRRLARPSNAGLMMKALMLLRKATR